MICDKDIIRIYTDAENKRKCIAELAMHNGMTSDQMEEKLRGMGLEIPPIGAPVEKKPKKVKKEVDSPIMYRITVEGRYCDICECENTPGGSFCEDGTCLQRRAWERLKLLEDIFGKQYDVDRLKRIVKAAREDRLIELPEGEKIVRVEK